MQAAIEEGVVVGGGCALLRLSGKVDSIKNVLDNEEQKVSPPSYSFFIVLIVGPFYLYNLMSGLTLTKYNQDQEHFSMFQTEAENFCLLHKSLVKSRTSENESTMMYNF